MSTNNIKMPLTYKGRYGFWRMLNILIFGLLVSGVMFTCYFIYQNVYSTIANANAITSLKSSVNIYDLDLQAYEKAQAAIEQKNQLAPFSANTRNIFYYSITTSTYAGSSTKP